MMRIATIVLLFGLTFPTLLQSQGETSNWYFGNGAGITFNGDGSVSALSSGKLNTLEGCASISDGFGDLLFYTDGIIVYNQNHQVMENGDGLFGDPSSTQSALIVPSPGDSDIFYIFTVDTKISQVDVDRGLNYSIVNMALDEGKGAVIQKNISLLADCSEKIAAVIKDCSNQSIWLITFASIDGLNNIFNTFHAFEINTIGIVKPAIKTTFYDIIIGDPRGYLKVSPDGTKLANANMSDGLYIYDFDTQTGIVSNQQKLNISGPNTSPYGVEFSSSNQYLYTHTSNDIFGQTGHTSSLIQFDLLSSNVTDSQVVLDSRGIYRGALQLGENGKIYRTNAKNYFQGIPFLSVINNPNQKGAATNYVQEAISLNGKNSTQGLPPFIQSFFNKKGLIQNSDGSTNSSLELCEGESFTLQVDIVPGGIYTWEKDGIAIPNTGNIIEVPIAVSTDSGKYRLTITPPNPTECPIIAESVVNVAPVPPNQNFVLEQCDIDENSTDGYTLIDLNHVTSDEAFKFTFYETDLDQINEKPITNPQQYTNTKAFSQTIFYKVTNEVGCKNFGELSLLINPVTISLSTASPQMVCETTSEDNLLEGIFDLEAIRSKHFSKVEVAFYTNLIDVSLEKNALNGTHTTTNTTLYARIEQINECQGIEAIELVVQPLPKLTYGDYFQVCTDGEPLVLEAPEGFDSYSWHSIDTNSIQEIGTTQQIQIVKGGTYSLTVGTDYLSDNQELICTTSSDFVVSPSNRAVFNEINIEDLSSDSSIAAIVTGDGEYEFSLDGVTYQDESLFNNVAPGFHTLFARDKRGCGITKENVSVIGFPKFFTPNGDGTNDVWQLIGASKDVVQGSISIYDRYGRLLKQITAIENGWNGTIDGQPLPSADYWFRVFLEGGKQFRGHFTLKR